MEQRPKAIFLMGATGTGKTDLAVALREHLPVEIISVDSALVFKDMNIGTAKPDATLLQRAPHRLIDFLDPAQSYSAAEFRTDALREMVDITAQGRIPLLVGGTFLYFRALEQGLSELPSADPVIRARLEAEAVEHGWLTLHERLQQIDPEAAARIHPNDPQRLQRALEIYELTGQTLTVMQQLQHQAACPYDIYKLALLPADREWLRERLALRFDKMLEQGLIDEVRALYERGDLHIGLPAVRSVGYRQIWEHFEGKIDYPTMRNHAIVATRQLAKRQLTWLRSESGLNSHQAENVHLPSVIQQLLAFNSG
ncbi:tRNA (adenosine(37)-N6)-dimethylallyltransferase MiaA [Thiolinea disciformis]|uniref:tRNA (adenosine(37)-N6)-dimethylallyltransferase MiaA n=1 Tax=Thiolinea disciformis TaxID=125614 RepID=UPI0003817A10|nr:tRNA (adenosine(37)-N6)-dimethylallyltransferase MiaA [Thiolinea disciformis]